jgi:uncharacterized protein YraI
MKNGILLRFFIKLCGLSLVFLLAACTSVTTTPVSLPTKPIAIIAAPQNNTIVGLGQEVVVTFTVADVKGIAQVELSIDGQPLQVRKVEPPTNSFAGNQAWKPDKPGSHVIELRAVNMDNQPSDPARVFINVAGPGDTTGGTSSPLETAAADEAGTAVAITLIPPSPPPAPATATPGNIQPKVTTLVGLNVRFGPGTDYPVVGRLPDGQTLPITGRNSEGTWWQITFPLGSNERGWISANTQFTSASNEANVPVVVAPPRPTPSLPTPTPTPALPVIHFFRADRDNVNPGDRVTLSWDLSGAKEAFLRYDDISEGVIAPGSKTVSPIKTTVYTLLARGSAGDATAQLTLNVNVTTATPVPVINYGKTNILNNQTIDFDRGFILEPSMEGGDFLWSVDQAKFVPQNGATGAFLGDPFDEIILDDCRSVTYGQPFPNAGSVSRITGCYRTNEGRLGKFFVPEWGSDGSLAIQWVTWDYR